MPGSNAIRMPRQKRSIEKKERILSAAYALFCEKGYYRTSTPEIAERAQVSTGCLYSYFTDKHMIFMELLGRCQQEFGTLTNMFQKKLQHSFIDFQEYFRSYFVQMIDIHIKYKNFFLEMTALYHSDAEIQFHLDQNKEQIQDTLLRLMRQSTDLFHVHDIEAAAIVLYEMIDAFIDRVAFYENKIDQERIIKEGLRAVYRYLDIAD
ncbi:TetR/AcrR family transcriptional regulator [Ethanoligenens sp.]|uniref:TetR/AcrR family transcriptional regulator n=1 Tax=Ethanoligenens sp. TaxID=2099655 RepID=UPI0039EB2AA3